MNIKNISVAVIAIVLISITTGWYFYNKPHKSVEGIEASIHLSADSLYSDYQQNEASANRKYLNKVIEVTGVISDIQNTNDSQIILLGSSQFPGGVSCKLYNDKNIKLKNKSSITVKGKCSGFLMDVNLVDCVVKN